MQVRGHKLKSPQTKVCFRFCGIGFSNCHPESPSGVRDLHFLGLKIIYTTSIKGDLFSKTSPITRPRTPFRPKAAKAASANPGPTATSNPPEVCGSKNKFR